MNAFTGDNTIKAYKSKNHQQESKRRLLDNSIAAAYENPDAQYVYNMLNEEFRQSRVAWAKPVPTLKYRLNLPSHINLLKKFSQSAVIIIFLGKLPFANDVAHWVQSSLGGCYVEGVYC